MFSETGIILGGYGIENGSEFGSLPSPEAKLAASRNSIELLHPGRSQGAEEPHLRQLGTHSPQLRFLGQRRRRRRACGLRGMDQAPGSHLPGRRSYQPHRRLAGRCGPFCAPCARPDRGPRGQDLGSRSSKSRRTEIAQSTRPAGLRFRAPYLLPSKPAHKATQCGLLAIAHRPCRAPENVSCLIGQQQHHLLFGGNLQSTEKMRLVHVQGDRIAPRLGRRQTGAQGRVQPPPVKAVCAWRDRQQPGLHREGARESAPAASHRPQTADPAERKGSADSAAR